MRLSVIITLLLTRCVSLVYSSTIHVPTQDIYPSNNETSAIIDPTDPTSASLAPTPTTTSHLRTESFHSSSPIPTSSAAEPTMTAPPPSTDPSLSIVSTPNAPPAIGPYAQAIKFGDTLFTSGNIPLNPKGELVGEGDIVAQTNQVLANLKAVLEAGGSEPGKVIKTTVFLKSLDDFKTVNEIYGKFFGSHTPARSAVQVAKLPLDVKVEIEAIASLK